MTSSDTGKVFDMNPELLGTIQLDRIEALINKMLDIGSGFSSLASLSIKSVKEDSTNGKSGKEQQKVVTLCIRNAMESFFLEINCLTLEDGSVKVTASDTGKVYDMNPELLGTIALDKTPVELIEWFISENLNRSGERYYELKVREWVHGYSLKQLKRLSEVTRQYPNETILFVMGSSPAREKYLELKPIPFQIWGLFYMCRETDMGYYHFPKKGVVARLGTYLVSQDGSVSRINI